MTDKHHYIFRLSAEDSHVSLFSPLWESNWNNPLNYWNRELFQGSSQFFHQHGHIGHSPYRTSFGDIFHFLFHKISNVRQHLPSHNYSKLEFKLIPNRKTLLAILGKKKILPMLKYRLKQRTISDKGKGKVLIAQFSSVDNR